MNFAGSQMFAPKLFRSLIGNHVRQTPSRFISASSSSATAVVSFGAIVAVRTLTGGAGQAPVPGDEGLGDRGGRRWSVEFAAILRRRPRRRPGRRGS